MRCYIGKRGPVLVVVGFGLFAASAAIPQDVDWANVAADSRFICLTADETTSDYNSKTWSNKWQGEQPAAGKWYFTNGHQMFVPNGNAETFPGDLLVLDSQFRNPNAGSSAASVKWSVKDFVALSGGFLGIRALNAGGLFVSGDMHVVTTNTPFQIVGDMSSRSSSESQTIELKVSGKLTGGESAEIHFGSSAGVYSKATPTPAQYMSAYILKLTAGDASGYKGRLTSDDASLELCSDFGGTVALKNARIGTELDVEPYPYVTFNGCTTLGSLVVTPCVSNVVKAAGPVTINTLTLAEGGEFNLDATGTWKIGKIVGKGGRLVFARTQGSTKSLKGSLEITGGFDANSRIQIANTAAAWTNVSPTKETRVALLTIASTVNPETVTLDRFALQCNDRTTKVADYGNFPVQDLELVKNEDGSQTLYLVGRLIVSSKAGDFTYADETVKWSDDKALAHAGSDYEIAYNDGPSTIAFEEDVVFPAANLLVRNAIVKIHADVCVTNLVLARQARLSVAKYAATTNRISGRMGVYAASEKPASFYVASTKSGNPYVLDVASDLYGAGVLQFTGAGIIRMTGDNSAFGGRLLWSDSDATTLEIGSATALGGELAELNAEAVVLRTGTLRPMKSLALSSNTRGIKVSGPATIDVPTNITFAVSNPLAVDAALTKTGAGVLSLGGTMTAGVNGSLSLSEGSLKPISGAALRGLSVNCKAGTGFLFDPLLMPQGVEIGGLTSGEGRVKVVLEVLDDGRRHRETFPLFVVSSLTQAKQICSQLSIKSPYAHHTVVLSAVENGDGTAKVVAEIRRFGICIVFR